MDMRNIPIDSTITTLTMPWGSTYWMIEAKVSRPALPNVFNRIGEASWVVIETSVDSAHEKLYEYMKQQWGQA